MNPQIKVLPADDQPFCHQAIEISLKESKNITIIGAAKNGADLLEQLPLLKPDVVLMDIHMPVMNGVQATRLARKLYPSLKILAYTTFEDEDCIIQIMEAGANGYIVKSASSELLIQGITAVMEGGTYYYSSISEKFLLILEKNIYTEIKQFGNFCQGIHSGG